MHSTARRSAGGILCLAFCIAAAGAVQAADIKLLTTGAMREVAAEMAQQFEKLTGNKVTVDNATAGGLAKRIGGGEAFDVAIITPPVVEDLITKGKLVAGSRIDLAKVGMGVAVKEGAKLPDIGSVEAFKQTLVDARAVAYTDPAGGGTSGIYFDKLLDRLGIAGPVRAKAKLKRGGYVAELVASGEADVAVHQISEILPVKGARLVGPLPAQVQNYTTYAVALSADARDVVAAKALIAHLAGPATAAALLARGMTKP
jgi:molybdate transport system substrate-binding protein